MTVILGIAVALLVGAAVLTLWRNGHRAHAHGPDQSART